MRLLMLGDSPLIETGFGRVNRHALKAFLAAGIEVGAVTALQTKKTEPTTDLPIRLFVPADNDEIGLAAGYAAIEEFKPDVIYATGDPGNVGGFTAIIPEDIPFVAYVPIEGEPIVHTGWRFILASLDFFTCSQYGVDVVKASLDKDVEFIYHGVDTEVFRPLSDDERTGYRGRLGWSEKFVITCVAQNVRRKQLPRLIEAIAILKKRYKQRDVVLYLHTVPYQGHWLEGWNLPEIADAFDVHDEVVFNPMMGKRGASVPEIGDFEVPGLRELVGSADLFMLPSQIEGFGLPIAEAMAVGVPVMVTKYGAGWEVARHGQGIGIPPYDYEVHKSGTRYANLDPETIAKEILSLKRDPKRLTRMREAGLAAVHKFDWAVFERTVTERVLNAAKAKAESPSSSRLPDQAPVEGKTSTDDVPAHSARH